MKIRYKNVEGYLIHYETVNEGVDMAKIILLDADTGIQYRFNCFVKDLKVVKYEEDTV